jgi:hypothetical protein
MSDGDGDGFQVFAENVIPDHYANQVRFEVSVYGFTLEFGQTQQPPQGYKGPVPTRPVVRVNMSPQHAKVMAKLLVNSVKAYESQVAPIGLPPELYKELGISEEW